MGTSNGTIPQLGPSTLPFGLPLELKLDDREVVAELEARAEGPERDEYAKAALKIGVLALKQARGQVDVDAVRHEGERLIGDLTGALDTHRKTLDQRLEDTLKEYFNPDGGRFTERVEKLVAKDGELETVVSRMLTGEESDLARRLDAQFGEHSRFARLLSPDDRDGFLGKMRETIERDVERQRLALLEEFRVDKDGSALQRLLNHVAHKNGQLRDDLRGEVEKLSAEFDFKNESSAISAMKRTLDRTQEAIAKDLSLDGEASALGRLKKELFEQLDRQGKSSLEFQQEIREAVAKLQTAKKERERSTTHGLDFEERLTELFTEIGRGSGHVVSAVGQETGLISRRYVGDVVVELGADHVAAGAKVVVEAKAEGNYTTAKMLAELDMAKKNRGAEVGLFVYAARHADEGADPLARHGDDLVVVWDPEDAETDWRVRLAFSVATAMCTRRAAEKAGQAFEFEAVEKAIRAVEKRIEMLAKIEKPAETIRKSSETILEEVGRTRKDLNLQVRRLDEQVAEMKESFTDSQT